jgi:phenylacetate-CoA ligase
MVRFHGIFINLPVIIKGQIIQETINDFTIKTMVQRRLFEEEKGVMIGRMKSQLGDVNINIEEVDNIPLGANGKFRAVISNLGKHVTRNN